MLRKCERREHTNVVPLDSNAPSSSCESYQTPGSSSHPPADFFLVVASPARFWERPFLGPLYSWSAAIRNKKRIVEIPAMLTATAKYFEWFSEEVLRSERRG